MKSVYALVNANMCVGLHEESNTVHTYKHRVIVRFGRFSTSSYVGFYRGGKSDFPGVKKQGSREFFSTKLRGPITYIL